MSSRFFPAVALLSILLAPEPDFPPAFEALHSLRPSESEAKQVSQATIERDGMRLEFHSGTVAPIRLQDDVVGCVFVGEGQFSYAPETSVERSQLERRLETPTIERGLDRTAVFFNDSTWHHLQPYLGNVTSLPGSGRGIAEDALSYLVDRGDVRYDRPFLTALLNPEWPGFFHAHVDADEGRDLFYRHDQSQYEVVSFGEDAKARGDYYDVISSYVPEALKEGRHPVLSEYNPAQTLAYKIEVEVKKNMDFSAVAELTTFLQAGGGTWIPFRLYSQLEVSEVTWDGQPLQVIRGDKSSSQLWVEVPPGTAAGAAGVMRFVYAGDLLERRRDFYFNKSATAWYPSSGQVDATFDVTFRYHHEFKLMAGGDRMSHEVEGDWITDQWVVSKPSPHNSFNVGDFDEETFEDPRVPTLTLHYSEGAHAELSSQLLQQKDMGRVVGTDLVNSLYFFEQNYGSLDATAFNATEIMAFHGQAFPSMVQLSFLTFQWTGKDGGDDIFRAHEVAHQWWGLGVRPGTYHDAWLSEGLAEYSGQWYMRRSLMDVEKHLEHLRDSKERIVERRGDAGPIWLGNRLVTSRTTEDYQIIVYEKGAWVIHMLRALLMDFDTMDEEPFNNMLRSFFEQYRGRSASTEDFKNVVEQSFGVDLTWFFDQWVYGVDIPEYRWATQGEQQADGYRMTLAVEQREAADDFKMIVPIRLDFGEDGYAHVKVLVDGPYSEMELPLLPREPDAIIFNDFESVLAEVDEVDWDDLRRP